MKLITKGLHSIDLASYTTPTFLENKRGNFIEFGLNNSFPNYLVDLYSGSSIHNTLINGKVRYIKGRGLTVDSGANTAQRAQLEDFIYNPNPFETWQEIFNKITVDYELYDGFAVQIIRDRTGRVSEVYHVDFGRLRVDSKNKDLLQYSEEWVLEKNLAPFEYNKNFQLKVQPIEIFNQNKNQANSVYYHREYRPMMGQYPLPSYQGALQAIRTGIEISNFDLNTIENGFAGGTLVNLFNGTPTPEEKNQLEDDINAKAAGSSNGNRILVNFADSKEAGGAEILSLMGNDLPDRFSQLEKRVNDSIFIGHSITSPMLFGVKTEGQLGGRTEMLEAYELFKETYVKGRRQTVLNAVNDIFEYKGLPRAMDIEDLRPMLNELVLSEATLIEVLGKKAIKEHAEAFYGIKAEEEENVNEETELQKHNFNDMLADYLVSKGESSDDYEEVAMFEMSMQDGVPTFELNEDTIEFSADSDKFEAEVANIFKGNPKATTKEVATVLKSDASKVEAAIKSLTKKRMIVVEGAGIRVLPSAMALIRLLPNPNEVLLIKYKYGLRLDKSGQPLLLNTSRAFCKRLASSNQLFNKQTILGMRNDMTVSFLPAITDVWLYGGGWRREKGSDVSIAGCRHTWLQVVVKQKK